MKGLIYIAGSFETVNRSACGRGKGWVDNDPHFWEEPPTWGICRPDLRACVEPGDFIFFVLPKRAKHPQCLFGYMRVKEKISHDAAFRRPELAGKHMGNKNPNGNIIVNEKGLYNRFDGGVHERNFDRIKSAYVVGDPGSSKFLGAVEIRSLAPDFLTQMQAILRRPGNRAIDVISRYGATLDARQVDAVVKWANTRPAKLGSSLDPESPTLARACSLGKEDYLDKRPPDR